MKFLALLVLALSLPAAAQQSKPQPEEPKQRERGETTLNLKLDEGGMRGAMRFEPRDRVDEKKAESALPGLGDGARTLQSEPSPGSRRSFPEDTERVYR